MSFALNRDPSCFIKPSHSTQLRHSKQMTAALLGLVVLSRLTILPSQTLRLIGYIVGDLLRFTHPGNTVPQQHTSKKLERTGKQEVQSRHLKFDNERDVP
jgi:hypothetical protein